MYAGLSKTFGRQPWYSKATHWWASVSCLHSLFQWGSTGSLGSPVYTETKGHLPQPSRFKIPSELASPKPECEQVARWIRQDDSSVYDACLPTVLCSDSQ